MSGRVFKNGAAASRSFLHALVRHRAHASTSSVLAAA